MICVCRGVRRGGGGHVRCGMEDGCRVGDWDVWWDWIEWGPAQARWTRFVGGK